MYIHSEKIVRKLTLAACMLLLFAISPKAQVNVVTVVTPPYTSNFSQYAEKLKVTAVSAVTGSLRLGMTIQGDNGINIQTLETGSVSITANVPLMIPEDYFYDFFDPARLKVTGISATELSQRGLPAGTYQICFKATAYNGVVTYNANSCSGMFRIILPEPPRVLQPLCGSDQFRGGIQNILFSWAPSPGAPRWTQYTLRIIEIRDSTLSPSQALRSGTRPPFFEEEVNGTSYLYGPKDPPLEKGCRYAFEIIAIDGETNTRFTNNGHSEMCYFKYGKEDEFFNPPVLETKPKASKTAPTAKQYIPGVMFSPANISGTLYYQYAGPNLPTIISVANAGAKNQIASMPAGNANTIPNNGNQTGTTKKININGQTLVLHNSKNSMVSLNSAASKQTVNTVGQVSGLSFFHNDIRDKAKSYPLANMPFSLVVKYMIYDYATSKMKMLSAYELNVSKLPARLQSLKPDQVLASGITDGGGNFDQTFLLHDSLGIVAKNFSLTTGSGEFKTSYKGTLIRVVRLMVGSNHYCSPAQDMIVQPGESASYDDLYALVRAYGLKVETFLPASSENYLDGPFEGIDVYIMRKDDITDVPKDEGYPRPDSTTLHDVPGFRVIAHAKTKQDGSASFMHLVKNLNGYDRYYIYVNSTSSKTLALKSYVNYYSNTESQSTDYFVVPENATYNDEYEYKSDYSRKVKLVALPPVVYGLVSLNSGAKDIKADNEGKLASGACVSLSSGIQLVSLLQASSQSTSATQMKTYTDDEGRFSITASTADGKKTFSVTARLDGYKTTTIVVNNNAPLLKGQKVEVGPIMMMTKALLSGKIVDSQTGTGVVCKVSVQGGLSVTSTAPMPGAKQQELQSSFTLQSDDISLINNMISKYVVPNMTKTTPVVFVGQGTNANTTNTRKVTQTSLNKPAKAVTGVTQTVAIGPLGPSYFALPSPSGSQTIIVEPDDNVHYFNDTLQVNLADGNNTAVIKAVRKMHRVKVIVKVEQPPKNLSPLSAQNRATQTGPVPAVSNSGNAKTIQNINTQTVKKDGNSISDIKNKNTLQSSTIQNMTFIGDRIANAKVRVVDRTEYVLTDNEGVAYLEFEGEDAFNIEVVPPEDKDFESKNVSFSGFASSKDFKEEEISLKKAAHISGKVTFNGAGIKGATVSLSNSGKDISTTTADDGTYTLRNVPAGETVKVMAAMSGYIGSGSDVEISSDAVDGIDLTLTKSTEFNYTRMLGFPIEVTKDSTVNGGHKISGYFTSLPANGQIDAKESDQKVYFKDIEVTKGSAMGDDNLPYPVPAEASVRSDLNTIPLKINNTFYGTVEDADGIKIAKGNNDNTGYLKGKVSLNTASSFQSNEAVINSGIYLMSTSSDQAPKEFNVIAADGTKPFGNGAIPIFSQNGKEIPYTLFGYNATAKPALSRIDGAIVKLSTVLHTNLSNTGTADLAVDLGDVELTVTMVKPISKTSPITMPLEQWNLKATSWSLNSNGFKLSKGEVVTHMANVEFTNMEIKPTELTGGTFDLKTLNIRNIATLNVTGNASLFSQNGHWFLAITPNGGECGEIDPLPGMPTTQKIKVTSVYLKSDKSGSFAVNMEPFKLYGIVDYTPTSLAVYDDRIEFPGTVDLNIPDVPSRSALISYHKSGSQAVLSFIPFTFKFATKGVNLEFTLDQNSLTSSGFTSKGTLSEPGLYSVNVQLNHSTAKTEIVDIPGQTFPIDKSGNKKLTNFDGEMHVNAGAWTNFTFNGDLTGAKGATSHMTFIVNGDVTADGQSVQMDKVSTPFGDLKLTFDFEHSRIIGSLEIEQDLAGTGFIKGSAESVIDQDGWYFCAGGKITMKNNPYIKEASTAMLFGDYPALNDPFITQTFANYSYSHALPTAFQGNISGFYIDGAAEFPVPYIPNIDINLVVVSGHVSVSAGGDFSLGMNYSDGVGTIYTGAALFVNASAGIGGSIGIACAGASFSVNAEIASHGELKTNGDWFLDGSATLTLSGSAYAGCGCCDSDCDGYYVCPCFSDDWSGSVSLGLLTHLGNDDNYIKINW
jgi:hypothetical protein